MLQFANPTDKIKRHVCLQSSETHQAALADYDGWYTQEMLYRETK